MEGVVEGEMRLLVPVGGKATAPSKMEVATPSPPTVLLSTHVISRAAAK